MKKILLFMLPLVALSFASCEKDNGNEDELSGDDIIQFEDPNFLKALLTVQEIDIYDPDSPDADSDGYAPYIFDVDENKDGQISVKEATKVRGMYLRHNEAGDESFNVSSMPEIKYFTALTSLNCEYNQLTTLDLSNNTALECLECNSNKLKSLDLSECVVLTDLLCNDNQLTSLDLSKNIELTELYCWGNQLASLDLSKNTALTYLDCEGNQLTTLDLSNNTALESLYCSGNPLTKIILNRNTKIDESHMRDIINEYGEDIIEYVE